MSIFKNLAKSVIAVAATPIAIAVDIVSLPATADSNKHPFSHTKKITKAASEALEAAIRPEDET